MKVGLQKAFWIQCCALALSGCASAGNEAPGPTNTAGMIDIAPVSEAAPPTEVDPGLRAEEIESVIKSNLKSIHQCYLQNLEGNRGNRGRVTAHWVISPNGRVESAVVKETTLKHAPTEECIVGAIRTWTFPEPRNGSTVKVNYPFSFMPRS